MKSFDCNTIGEFFLEGTNYCEPYKWEDLCYELGEYLSERNPEGFWKAKAELLGWRGLSGYKCFKAAHGEAFLREILPHGDCRFRIYINKSGLALNNFHHDSLTGREWYFMTPCTEAEYEENS